jgi:DNA polymerase III subunit gamma/tau
VTADGVRSMLGVADTSGVYTILEALTQRSTASALKAGQALLDAGVSASNVLQELAAMACRLAVLQSTSPTTTAMISHSDQALLAAANGMSAEHVQLVYGIALRGIQDAPFAPNEYAALAMPVLRMQVFAPMGGNTPSSPSAQALPPVAPLTLGAEPTAAPPATVMSNMPAQSQPSVIARPPTQTPLTAAAPTASSIVLSTPTDWPAIANGLPLAALARTAARQSACTHIDGLNIYLALPTSQLAAPDLTKRVQDALRAMSGKNYQLHTTVVESSAAALSQTASAQDQVHQVQVQNAAEQAFHADELVKGLIAVGAQVVTGSIKPVLE